MAPRSYSGRGRGMAQTQGPAATTDVASQGWGLGAPGDDVKEILTRQRAGGQLSDRDWQRLSQRTAAENETIKNGNSVEGAIQPKRLSAYETGVADAAAVKKDAKDISDYAAGRGFPAKPAGPSAEVQAARTKGLADAGRAGSGGAIYSGSGDAQKLNIYAGSPARKLDGTAVAGENKAPVPGLGGTSGGTITDSAGKVTTYAGKPGAAAPEAGGESDEQKKKRLAAAGGGGPGPLVSMDEPSQEA